MRGVVATPTEPRSLSFAQFFEREHLRLGRAIFLLTGDRDEAEDLVQEALARAYERWDRVSQMGEPAAYVYRIASNLHRRRSRTRLRQRTLVERRIVQDSDPGDVADARMDVLAALAMLPQDQRDALVLVEMFGFDTETAAQALGIRPVSVRVRLHRARLRLRDVLGGEDV
jgi:RNA polymerase sigma-70 factor (ECF subfamily)